MKNNFKAALAQLQEQRFSDLELNTTSFNQLLPCAYYVTPEGKTLVLNIEGAGEYLDVAASFVKQHGFGLFFGKFAGLTEKLPTKIEKLGEAGPSDTTETMLVNGITFYARPNGLRNVYTVHIAAHVKQGAKRVIAKSRGRNDCKV